MVLEGIGDEQEWPLTIEVIDRDEQDPLLRLLGAKPRQEKPRYRAGASFPNGDEPPTEMNFDCQVIAVGDHRYLTFQEALAENELALIYLFDVPLQNTLRMELEGDELRLLMHEKRYLWVPMAFSGKLEMGEEGDAAGLFGVLLPSLDAVLDAYEETGDDGWQVICRGRRVER